MSQTLLSRKALVPVLAATAMAAAGLASAASLDENFEGVSNAGPAGWTVLNVSSPIGVLDWFVGDPLAFSAHAGTDDSYIASNFNNTTGSTGTISNWLWTPTLTFNNGDVVSFYTRQAVGLLPFADRLELRFSTGPVVNPTAVGGGDDDGSFSTLLLSVNPSLAETGYPSVWTQYTATISGLSGPTAGNVAFRYFVTNGGPQGVNSNYIGIDTFSITAAIPEPGTYGLMGLGIAGVLLAARRRKQA